MASLQSMQRLAEREIAKLGLAVQVRVVFSGTVTRYGLKPCKVNRRASAHAHCDKNDHNYGSICVKRGVTKRDWRDLIRHEVAHFAPGGGGHGTGFLRVRAKQGHAPARIALRYSGELRCPKHRWHRGQEIRRVLTAAGLVVTYQAVCENCGRTKP